MAKKIGDILMSNGLPKHKARINLGGSNITTMDFGRFKVIHSSLLMPGDKVKLDIAHNVRLSPLVAPTIGKCDLKFKSFFVPARCAFEGFHPLITDTQWWTATGPQIASMPSITNAVLSSYFTSMIGVRNTGITTRKGHSIYDAQVKTLQYLPLDIIQQSIDHISPYYNKSYLTELVGVCSDFGDDGSPLDYKPVIGARVIGSSGKYAPIFGDRVSQYTGKDIDIISLPTGRGITKSASSTDIEYFEPYWMHQPTQSECTGHTGPWDKQKLQGRYVCLRFTTLGKSLFDLFVNLGYSINFCCPSYSSRLAVDTDNNSQFGLGDRLKIVNNNVIAFKDDCVAVAQQLAPSTNISAETTRSAIYSASDQSESGYGVGAKQWILPANNSNAGMDNTLMNALPLHSYLKVFLDHLCPMQYYHVWATLLENMLHINAFQHNLESLRRLIPVLTATYDKDYFTTAWETPNSPVTGLNNYGIQESNGGFSQDANGNITTDGTSESYDLDGTDKITGLGIRLLNALTKYKRLNNVSGSRAVDRLLARYGTRPSDERVNRAEIIGSNASQFDVSLVMSQAQTDGASLGDYSAHCESRNSGGLGAYTASEWGYLIVIAYIVPSARYVQGRYRQNTYMTVKDFLVPEFDEVDAMQAIRQDELFADNRIAPYISKVSTYYKPNGTFGYTRAYAEMKVGRDILSGDFRLDSRGKYSNESFHLCRMIPTLPEQYLAQKPVRNDNDFNTCSDAWQYDRIFQFEGNDYDHFFCYFKIDVDCTRNTKPITDYTMNDENDDTRVSKSEMFGHQL